MTCSGLTRGSWSWGGRVLSGGSAALPSVVSRAWYCSDRTPLFGVTRTGVSLGVSLSLEATDGETVLPKAWNPTYRRPFDTAEN